MVTEVEIEVSPEQIDNDHEIGRMAAAKLGLDPATITAINPVRRSLDARRGPPRFRLRVQVWVGEPPAPPPAPVAFAPVGGDRRAIVVGSGPAGIFAALRLIQHGIQPVLLERGSDVQTRRRDLRAIQQHGIVNPESNYCFGEGGAGTYSDGKLYTRSTKRGDARRILALLRQHGAPPEILVDSHPHIGSDRLPAVVQALRQTLLTNGGELRLGAKVTDLILDNNRVRGVVVNDAQEQTADAVILATGHSAREIYQLLHRHGIALEPKSFAMGVRIEHPQALIDEVQYRQPRRAENLPAASYHLACQVDGRGVYTFCMCPGGMIIPSSTAPDELVLNGMSPARRCWPFANAGLVVAVQPEDWQPYRAHGVFAGLQFQRELESLAFSAGGGAQRAPAQRATDFVRGKRSPSLAECSYQPGVTPASLHELLPPGIAARLRRAIPTMGRTMRGFYSEEAQLLGVETRTSSPIRIPRDRETLMHVTTAGLFPSGEGAGYAGGIISSAIDGERSADAVARYLGR